MVPDRQKVRTDGWTDRRTDGRNGCTDRQTHGRRQNYIPPTSSGDNKIVLDQSAPRGAVLSMSIGLPSSENYSVIFCFVCG